MVFAFFGFYYLHCLDFIFLNCFVSNLRRSKWHWFNWVYVLHALFHVLGSTIFYQCIYLCYLHYLNFTYSCSMIVILGFVYLWRDILLMCIHVFELSFDLLNCISHCFFPHKSYVYINRDTDEFSELDKGGFEFGKEHETRSMRNTNRKRGGLVVCYFVCWNKTRKTTRCLLRWEESKPPGSDHTRAEAQTTCTPKTAVQTT